MKTADIPPGSLQHHQAPWEHLADELHRLGYSYGYTRGLFPGGRLAWIVDAYREGGHDYRVTAATRGEAFDEIVTQVWHTCGPR